MSSAWEVEIPAGTERYRPILRLHFTSKLSQLRWKFNTASEVLREHGHHELGVCCPQSISSITLPNYRNKKITCSHLSHAPFCIVLQVGYLQWTSSDESHRNCRENVSNFSGLVNKQKDM